MKVQIKLGTKWVNKEMSHKVAAVDKVNNENGVVMLRRPNDDPMCESYEFPVSIGVFLRNWKQYEEPKTELKFQIGDWVETDDPQHPLICATRIYDFAIVVESDPLTLKSRSGGMTWFNRRSKLRKIDFDKICNLLKGEQS